MPVPMTAWRPTVAEVAAVIPHRTGDKEGTAQGTFTFDTVPTVEQVESVVRQIQSEVAAVIGDMPDALAAAPAGGTVGESMAGRVVILGVAADIERSFYPDLQLAGDSVAAQLAQRYRDALAALANAAVDADAGSDPGDPLLPTAVFPVASPIHWADL